VDLPSCGFEIVDQREEFPDMIQETGKFVVNSHRFLVEARK
jgi:hypothetical protein